MTDARLRRWMVASSSVTSPRPARLRNHGVSKNRGSTITVRRAGDSCHACPGLVACTRKVYVPSGSLAKNALRRVSLSTQVSL